MRLNADIIYQNLSQHLVVKRLGRNIQSMVLSSPVFCREDTVYQSGKVYVTEANKLPAATDTECLIICVGREPHEKWKSGLSCVFIVTDEPDILRVFNILQDIYELYDEWSIKLREILDGSASIAEMIRVTAPLFGNPIALCNNRLEIEAVSGSGDMEVSPIGPVSEKYTSQFLSRHAQNTAMREPFLYKIGGISAYCINIYKQDSYLGLITLGDSNRQFKPGDFELFCYFYKFVSEAAEKRMNIASGQFVTIKSVFHDLLDGLPVSASIIHRALKKEPHKGNSWVCAAIKPPNTHNELPTEYLCALLESRVPKSAALFADPYIAMFMSVSSGSDNDAVYALLAEALEGLSMRAGVSYRFEDIEKAKYYFRQAAAAIETADIFTRFKREETLCFFRDHALLYALRGSVGEFLPEYMLPDGLLKLRDKGEAPGSVDYWETLKVYLDNEMNATETAKKLFIHRTTLQTRLAKLRESVDLSSPFKRMYIRYCIYLMDSLGSSKD